jgi:23S rRNA (cytidine1920-2'-O)/16S rRNA (cytidine1409-2'-O)-methyltransferase
LASRHRARFVALTRLVRDQYPGLEDPLEAILCGRVLVDGRTITNPRAQVRADAGVRVVTPRRLRGHTKLAAALVAFDHDVTGAVAVDVGAAAGGFTTALVERGASLVYAVDVGHGQLAPTLQGDARVVNLERTNVASLDDHVVPEAVDVVTLDLSYLAVAVAVPALDRLRLTPDPTLLALVKPTFELRAAALVTGGARSAPRSGTRSTGSSAPVGGCSRARSRRSPARGVRSRCSSSLGGAARKRRPAGRGSRSFGRAPRRSA